MAITKKTTIVEEGLANLIAQFEDKVKLKAFLATYLVQVQDLENAFCTLFQVLNLNEAVGAQLDIIGALVGEQRAGRSDDQYLIAIQARILLNISEGTIEDVIGLALAVSGAPVTVTLLEDFPAAFSITINEDIDPLLVDTTRMAAIIASGRPVAVKGILIFHAAGSFQFDGVGSVGFDEGLYGMALNA
jgi:hypothetical protein